MSQAVVRQIETLLNKAAKGLLELRLKRKVFIDDFYKQQHTFMQICEGLEGVLMPALLCPTPSLLKRLFTEPVAREIEKDIEYIEGAVANKDYAWFSGEPYYMRGGPREHTRIPRNSIDALAFFTSVLCHLLGLLQRNSDYSFGQYDETTLKRCLDKCIGVILESTLHNGNGGWPGFLKSELDDDETYVDTPDQYCTWSMLETIEEIRTYYPEGYAQIQDSECLDQTREWLRKTMDKNIDNCQKFLANFHKSKTASQAECRCFYHAAHGLAGLAILGSVPAQQLGHFTAQVLNAVGYLPESEFKTFYPNIDAPDYTLFPMLLRCLSVALKDVDKKVLEKSLGKIATYKDETLLDLYKHIVSKKLYYNTDGVHDGFFCDRDISKSIDEDDKAKKVDIYYTERVVESLLTFHGYLCSVEDDPTVQGLKAPKLALKISLAKEQMAVGGSSEAAARLPALDYYSHYLRTTLRECFNDCRIICVQHFLSDLLTFVESLKCLGADPHKLILIRKTYGYPEGDEIEKLLIQMGTKVIKLGERLDEQRKQVSKILKDVIKRCSKAGPNLLIIEDGGYVVPLLHTEIPSKSISMCLGAVEQTTNGINKDKKVKELKIPIVDVARSKLKQEWETPEVAETLAENIRKVCGWKEVSWAPAETSVLVLGCGKVGKPVAENLCRMHFQVSAYDNLPKKRRKIKEDFQKKKLKITVLDRIEDYSQFKILLGISSNKTINRKVILSCQDMAILASGSSERQEIDLVALEEMTQEPLDKHIIGGSKEHPIATYELKHDRRVRVLCSSEPINFALSSGIPNPAIEPVLMQMLWGAANLASGAFSGRKGLIHFPRKAEREILEDFYRKTK